MSLSDRVTKPPERRTGLPCSVGQLLNTLEGDEHEALVAMLGDQEKRDGWPSEAIFDALTAEGHHVGYQTIGRHRRGRCKCGKP